MIKKGQEEIVGFVLIVVLVVIVAVIFLGIRLRNPEPAQRESEIVYQFLESAMEQTTSCKTSESGNFLAFDSLVRDCHSVNSLCVSGDKSCEIVKQTLDNMLNSTWSVGPAYPYKGYSAIGDYNINSTGESQQESIFNLTSGNCGKSFVGSSYWIPEFPGNIIVRLNLCS
mgnify:FL=1